MWMIGQCTKRSNSAAEELQKMDVFKNTANIWLVYNRTFCNIMHCRSIEK